MLSKAGSLTGQVIVVTGATSGIGAAVAGAFAREGANVVLFARRPANLGAGLEASAQTRVLAVPGDVGVPGDVQGLFDRALARFGEVNCVVNCAGVFPKGSFLALPDQEWQAAVATNLLGFALVCRYALPHMIQAGFGRIVNINTRLAVEAHKNISAYSVSKAGAGMLTRCIAAEISQSYPDILINDLIPGPTKTNMNEQGQDPINVVPFVRQLILLPRGGPTGKSFFYGREYPLWSPSPQHKLRSIFTYLYHKSYPF